MILPLNNFRGNSDGENFVWDRFQRILPKDYVSFHNYHLGLKQADVILFVPRFGIIIIEIKGFYAKNIIDVPDRTVIRLKYQPPEPSPFAQAIKYRNILLQEFMQPAGVDSVYVTCAVCYPFITKEEYKNTSLNKISHETLTITAEDLTNWDALQNKIEEIFAQTYNSVSVPTLVKYGFEDQFVEKVGNLISPNFRNTPTQTEESSFHAIIPVKREYYSVLRYVKKTSGLDENAIDDLIGQWKNGTKVYLYSDDASLISFVRNKLKEAITQRNLIGRKAFELGSSGTFMFNLGLVPELSADINIVNGEDIEKNRAQLDLLHNYSGFNRDQFEIEHAPLEDIIVKAGAGTGKTYSIVSRINYLIWKKEYNAEDLQRAIVLITFTNESADAMKERISDNFMNFYLLTSNPVYLDLIETVENMSISTIHSITKKILQRFASKLGLGRDFKIITGDYKRRQILHATLNKYIIEHPELNEKIDLSMFHLSERLIDVLDKLDNKNVDIVLNQKELNFGKDNYGIFDNLIEVLYETQCEMNSYCIQNNSVCLGDLIRKLRVLYDKLETKILESEKVDFLFVDEFQDTDDIQIELMKKFRELFGFKFFVVGDTKQCIYRFRGAEVQAFSTLGKGQPRMYSISLNKNYRTDILLINKLNEVFINWNDAKRLDYSGKDVLLGTKDYCSKAELYNLSVKTPLEFEKRLADTITEMRHKLESPKDKIAILVRYNWQVAQVRELCAKNGIYVETEIGGELFKIDPTIDLFKLIMALRYNKTPKYLYNLYTTSYVQDELPKLTLWGKKREETTDYYYANLPEKLIRWNDYLSRLHREPVLRVIRDIVDDVKPWEIFARKIGAERCDAERSESYYIRNLDQLFEKLILASNTDYLTLNKLSDYLEIMILTRREEESRESYDIENSASQVICTTVHKAKGLEFDTVVLPYCDFDISSSRTKGNVDLIYAGNDIGYRVIGTGYKPIFENDLYGKFQKDEIIYRKNEETRILYVALTRAIRRIVYFSNLYNPRQFSDCWDSMMKGCVH